MINDHDGDNNDDCPVSDGDVHDANYHENYDTYDDEYDDSDNDDVDDNTFQEHSQTWLGGGFLVFPGRRRRHSQSASPAILRCRGGWKRRRKVISD